MSSSAKRSGKKATTDSGAAAAQRAALCAAVAMLTYWGTSGALFLHFPEAQRAILVGIVAGLIGGAWTAGGSALGVGLVGMLTGPANIWGAAQYSGAPTSLLWVALGAAVAAGVALGRKAAPESARWVFWFAIAAMVVNMWTTVFEVAATPPYDEKTGTEYASVLQSLEGATNVPNNGVDEALYVWVVSKMRFGMPFYQAFAEARPAQVAGANGPSSIMNFREPLLFYVVKVAHDGRAVLGLLLSLATAAAVGLVPVLRRAVKAPVVITGVALVLTYATALATTVPLATELWAGLLCLIAVELTAASFWSSRWQALTAAAAGVALCAFLVRELVVFVLIAGLVSAWLADREQRRYRVAVWGGAFALAAAGYAAHAVAASRHVVPAVAGRAAEGFTLFGGGPLYALQGLVYATQSLALAAGPGVLLPSALALLGLVGVLRLPSRDARIVASSLIAGVFAIGLIAGNKAHVAAGGDVNYWGVAAQFVVYACVPLVFAFVPAARVRQAASTKDRQ